MMMALGNVRGFNATRRTEAKHESAVKGSEIKQ